MKAVNREILRIALPSIVSNITVPLLGLVDVTITGHMGGAEFVGAIAVGGMLFNIIYWLFAFLRMGTSGATAQAYGAHNYPQVVAILKRNVTLALVLSMAVLCLQTPICEVALALIDPSEEVLALSRTYFNICVWGAPPSLLLFALSGWFLGMQNSRAPMAIAIIQNVSNILLSLFFVYVLRLQIEGVALGTVVAQYVGLLSALWMLRSYSQLKRYNKYSLPLFGEGGSVDLIFFLRTLCLIFVHFFFISAGAKYGNTALAINALIMQLFLLFSYFMDGFAYAGEALVGKAIGAEKEVGTVISNLFKCGVIMMGVFTLAYALCDRQILALLTDEQSVLLAADEYHWWTLLLPVCGMAAFIWDGIYIGATRPKGMLISIAISMLLFFSLFKLLSPSLGNHAMWLAFNAYTFTRGAIQTLLWPRKQINQKY